MPATKQLILTSMNLLIQSHAICVQGPCNVGFVDESGGNYEQWMEIDCADINCVGGSYYASAGCECACIPPTECPTAEEEESGEPMSPETIVGIIIGSLFAAIVFVFVKRKVEENQEQLKALFRERRNSLLAPFRVESTQERQQREDVKDMIVLDRMSSQQLDEYLKEYNEHGLASNGIITVPPQVLNSLNIEVNGWKSTAKGLPVDFAEFVEMKVKHPECKMSMEREKSRKPLNVVVPCNFRTNLMIGTWGAQHWSGSAKKGGDPDPTKDENILVVTVSQGLSPSLTICFPNGGMDEPEPLTVEDENHAHLVNEEKEKIELVHRRTYYPQLEWRHFLIVNYNYSKPATIIYKKQVNDSAIYT